MPEPKERPILFNAEMVQAILRGDKTETRRVVKGAPMNAGCVIVTNSASRPDEPSCANFFEGANEFSRGIASIRCPYGRPGDRLWVKETHAYVSSFLALSAAVKYRADGHTNCDVPQDPFEGKIVYNEDSLSFEENVRWRPSIFMPRWASRLLLEVEEVRVERVQDITPESVFAEGVGDFVCSSPDVAREMFARLWDSINAKRGFSWESNPFVWNVRFRRLDNLTT